MLRVSALVGKRRTTDSDYLDYCKAFDMVPHNVFVTKLENYGSDGWTVRRIRNWLDGHMQRAAANHSMSKQRSVSNGVPQTGTVQYLNEGHRW